MSTHKVVTLETLTQAMEDAQSGLEVGTTAASYVRMVYDALPTPPLDADVQAHIDWLEAEWVAWGNPAVRAIITALHAGAVANAQLRAALVEARVKRRRDAYGQEYHRCNLCHTLSYDGEAHAAVCLLAEPSALAERYRALEAMEALARKVESGESSEGVAFAHYILHGEASDD